MNNEATLAVASEHAVERIIEWHDSEPTGAKGWIVIDCLINGVSGGGLFMHEQASEQEVTDLAKSMTFKNGLQSPQFGGGKGGIRFDPKSPEAPAVLRRFLLDNKEHVENFWCTGADLNTNNDVIHDIIQNDLKLESGFHCLGKMLHTRFGIEDQSKKMLARIREKMNPIFPLSESATGYTVAKCIEILVPGDARIVIQGFGAVGKSLAYFIREKGLGRVVGISEANGYIYHEDGIDVAGLFAQKNNKNIPGTPLIDFLDTAAMEKYNWTPRGEAEQNEDYLVRFLGAVEADVFCPCATRYQLTGQVLTTLEEKTFAGSQKPFIICGANNIYDRPETFHRVVESPVETIPEWVSNCGNALLFMEALKSTEHGPLWVASCLAEMEDRLESLFAGLDADDDSLSLYEKCHRHIKNKVDTARLCNN